MNRKEVPVLLLTGYLGSGKTTLVNRILSNEKGVRFAVIVNDIGEVNIDADLIQRGGVVGTQDDSLVALQNGCICCTLKTDLMNQITELIGMQRFDYIVIEASGICEPDPIARTICTMPRMDPRLERYGAVPRLDCIVTVVDAMRLRDEFAGGESLMKEDLEEDDIENLIIQQIEFCNIVLLNKASDVEPADRARIRCFLAYCAAPFIRTLLYPIFCVSSIFSAAARAADSIPIQSAARKNKSERRNSARRRKNTRKSRRFCAAAPVYFAFIAWPAIRRPENTFRPAHRARRGRNAGGRRCRNGPCQG